MKSAISRSFDQQSPAPTPPYGLRKDGRGKRLKFEYHADDEGRRTVAQYVTNVTKRPCIVVDACEGFKIRCRCRHSN